MDISFFIVHSYLMILFVCSSTSLSDTLDLFHITAFPYHPIHKSRASTKSSLILCYHKLSQLSCTQQADSLALGTR